MFLLAVSLLAAPHAAAADGPKRRLTHAVGTSVNPVGLQDQLGLSWRWGLGTSQNPLLSDAHFAAGVTNHFSPAYDRVEMWAELSPLSVLDLKAGVEPVYYFGTFGHLSSFAGYDADFSKEARDAIKDRAVSRTGMRYHFSPTFKIKVGRVAAVTGAQLEWWRIDGPGDFFYEPMRDTLLDSDGDRSLLLASQVFYEIARGPGKRQILAGLFHDRLAVSGAPGNNRQRLGPILVWTLGDRRLGMREPAVIGAVFSHLQDPSKDGQIGAFLALTMVLAGE